MELKKTPEGKALLHIWRTGQSYRRQKEKHYRAHWNNLYFSLLPQPPGEGDILYYDIRRPFPFEDNSFDGIYAFHIIEHLTPVEAGVFALELFRVLKPGGICRISTPDLEEITREYLKQLNECWERPTEKNVVRYDWIKLEMLDQMVRDKNGGVMKETVEAGYFDPEYAKERYGEVFREFVAPPPEPGPSDKTRQGSAVVKKLTPSKLVRAVINRLRGLVYRYQLKKKEAMLGGDPRRTLEINKWTHDRLSLKLLLSEAGFTSFKKKTYAQSDIPGWDRYQLDTSDNGGHPIEPSLYVEVYKE